MNGHLHLVCSPNDTGRPCLGRQSFCAPYHLSKPYEDAGTLVVNVVNPTAGLFDGDVVDLRATVEAGARLVLTTPSSCRVYRSRSGKAAVSKQKIHVCKGAFAEFLPEPLIPHAGAILHQTTELSLEEGAELLYFEWLAPGRVASGEAFAYEHIHWQTDLRIMERLVARERYNIRPAAQPESLTALRAAFPVSHYLGCFFVADVVFPVEAIEALQSEGNYLGWTPLAHGGGWAVKALCSDSLGARRLLRELRVVLYQAMGREMPGTGRL